MTAVEGAAPRRGAAAAEEGIRKRSDPTNCPDQEGPDRMQRESGSPEVEVRRATADDAQAIGAVFDAAVRAG
jgi:hypothetical protein